jgi:uncharacterized membrane protein
MNEKPNEYLLCPICKERKPLTELIHREIIRPPIVQLIEEKNPEWHSENIICLRCLNKFRADYIQSIYETERGELSELDKEIVESLRNQELISIDVNEEFEEQLSFGNRLSDKIAEFGGSWPFIIIFGSIVFVWIFINSIFLLQKPFDPYPYILLNLFLSCLAAMQAPVIMMSQNRQEAKDRLRSENDYRINIKAELEIRHLHAKMDQLITHQWSRLLEIQQIQMDLMEEFSNKLTENSNSV